MSASSFPTAELPCAEELLEAASDLLTPELVVDQGVRLLGVSVVNLSRPDGGELEWKAVT